MFQQIEPDQLQYNEKYKIVSTKVYSGIYKGILWRGDQMYLEFDDIKTTDINPMFPRYFPSSRLFYKYVSQKERIQTDMEHRAVNQIIRRVLGDECFMW